MFDKIKDILFKIKDYDRLEHDYSAILCYITDSRLCNTTYGVNWLYTFIDDILTLRDEETRKEAEKDLGWISVKDRLPDTTDYMFTCIEMNGIPQCVGFHYYKDGKWFEGFEEDTVGAVEYWMPIPKLPKEDEK